MTRNKTLIFSLMTMLGGAVCGLALIWGVIQLVPQLEPGGQRFIFTDLDGDTFRHQPGLVRPPTQNRLLEDVIRYDDADGFRRPALVADHYPIIAIGDSFTDGGQVPWVDFVAQALNTPVRNLGWSGFGPLEYAEVMKQYGTGERGHEWVLVMFFEGNDLSNIQTSYTQAQAHNGVVQLNLTRVIAPPQLNIRSLDEYTDIQTNADDWYLYPLTHTRPDGTRFEMAYISDYLWWLNGGQRVYQESRNLALLKTALDEIRSAAGDACVALIYAPTKEHVYFPLADPDGNRIYVLQNALRLIPSADGWLSFSDVEPVAWDDLAGRLDHMRTAVQKTALDAGWQFIDLLPAFQQAAASGEGDLAYYPYDSHWSSRGHQIAGETVAAYLRENPCP